MKSLTTNATAAALGITRKTLDNVLAREARALLAPGSRGKSRRIPIVIVERVAVALILNRDLGVSISRAIELSGLILAHEVAPVRITVGPLIDLAFDVPRLRAALELSIEDALETLAERTRGRPCR